MAPVTADAGTAKASPLQAAVLAAVLLFGSFISARPVLAQRVVEQAVVGGRYYAQGGGFAVTDVRGQPFYSAFQRLGGVAQLGYPVSRRFFLDGFTCQAMQVGLLQYLPETGQVVLANTFELLSRFGADDWLFARGIPRPIRDDGSTSFAASCAALTVSERMRNPSTANAATTSGPM